MPVNNRSNNRVLPANSRAVDVAKRTIRDLTSVQQRRYHNAFEVQGYEAILYSRLNQGLMCSCQANRKVQASILNEEGKMSPGHMNELVTGGLEFTIDRYGATRAGPHPTAYPTANDPRTPARVDQTLLGNFDENKTPFEIVGNERELDDPFMDVTARDGVNGPNQNITLDELADGFDHEVLDLGGTSCTCCMGTGYVGGYSVLYGYRKVIAPHSPEVVIVDGEIDALAKPHRFYSNRVEFNLVLPRGYVSLDALRLWDNADQVTSFGVTIDGLAYSVDLLRALCDGRSHTFVIMFDEKSKFTHFELQINLSTNSALIEFPRLTQGSNNSLADMVDGAQINASPLIPHLATQDVFVESVFGKVFRITSSNWWNDNKRNVHGWDCQTVVVQPHELQILLPRRRQMKQRTSNPVRDNQSGIRRT